jgi:hypothetical protein
MDVFTAIPQKYSNGRAGLVKFFDVGLGEFLSVQQGEEFAAVLLHAGVFSAEQVEQFE